MANTKIIYLAILLAIMYIALSIPSSYVASNTFLSRYSIRTTFDNAPGLPTMMGVGIHACAFFVCALVLLFIKDRQVLSSRSNAIPKSKATPKPNQTVMHQESMDDTPRFEFAKPPENSDDTHSAK